MHDATANEPLPCWVYGSTRHQEMYLYLPVEEAFDQVPKALLERFGTPRFVMELQLFPELNLAREDTLLVMENLRTQGFHLQMPPQIETRLYRGD